MKFLVPAFLAALVATSAWAQQPAPSLPTEENVEDLPPEEKAKAPKKVAIPAAPPMIWGEKPKTSGVVLQALDKISTRITPINVAIGQSARFGSLKITVKACSMHPPEEEPESAAFLEIDDIIRDGSEKRVFSGWMFASSPALSALEHPVYDVWVTSCKIASGPVSASSKR